MNRFVQAAAVAAMFVTATWAQAADEVKLIKAQSTVQSHYGFNLQQTSFDVVVKNLAYAKKVYAHLKNPDGLWIDVPMTYNRATGDGREVWTGSYSDYTNQGTPTNRVWTVEYTLKYEVNGQTFWDNNNGQNYSIAPDVGAYLVGTNIYPVWFSPTQTTYSNQLTGRVVVKNIAPAKTVKVVYSTDGWKTVKTSNASFTPYAWSGGYSAAPNPNQYGYEVWDYSMDVGATATKVDFAFSYTVNGQTYWDNNFGANYSSTIQRQ